MKITSKIDNQNLIIVAGVRYEWNDFTKSYWSVCRMDKNRTVVQPRELQKKDVQ